MRERYYVFFSLFLSLDCTHSNKRVVLKGTFSFFFLTPFIFPRCRTRDSFYMIVRTHAIRIHQDTAPCVEKFYSISVIQLSAVPGR